MVATLPRKGFEKSLNSGSVDSIWKARPSKIISVFIDRLPIYTIIKMETDQKFMRARKSGKNSLVLIPRQLIRTVDGTSFPKNGQAISLLL